VVEVIREVVQEAAPTQPVAQAAVPVVAKPVVTVRAPRIDRVVAPRSVKLAKARKGVAILVTTGAASIKAKADKGAKVTATPRRGTGFRLVFKAARKGTFKVTVSLPTGASRTVSLTVR
jgi:hypothetical protein